MYLKKSLLRLLGEVPPHESARLHEVGIQLALHLLLHPPPRDEGNHQKIKCQTVQHQGCGSAFISSVSGSNILDGIPIRIQSGSRAVMTKN
jgi:hypothetical protein